MADDRNTITTPHGTLLWPRLTEPDYKFNEKGVFSTKIALDPSPELTDIITALDLMRDEFIENLKKKDPKKYRDVKLADMPYKKGEDDKIVFTTHSYASGISKKTGKPWTKSGIPMYDRAGIALMIADVKPWTGTIARVNFAPVPFFLNNQLGAGVTLYLQAVQIIKLVSGSVKDASDYGFSEEPESEETDDENLPF